jgi:Domain of unknown function (DUF4157)
MAFKFTYLGRPASVHVRALIPRLLGADGTTIGKHIFIKGGQASVSPYLLAHEFGHVVQWSRLGPLGFLRAYFGELLRKGYRNHSMEKEAHEYAIQHLGAMTPIARFIQGRAP